MATKKANQAVIDQMLTQGKGNASALYVCSRALVAIWQRQTADEQASKSTTHDNGIGFSQADASQGTKLAEFVMGINPSWWTEDYSTKNQVDGAARDGVVRRKPYGKIWRKGVQVQRADLVMEMAWKYRKQIRRITYGA